MPKLSKAIPEAREIVEKGSVSIGADIEIMPCVREGMKPLPTKYNHLKNKVKGLAPDGPALEFHPKASYRTQDIIEDLRRQIISTYKLIPRNVILFHGASVWCSSRHRHYWMGGHIHFGLKGMPGDIRKSALLIKYITNMKKNSELEVWKSSSTLVSSICRGLDLVLANTCLPLDRVGAQYRRSGCTWKYGMAGDHRVKSPFRFEYRTLSSFWIANPAIAEAVLEVSRIISSVITISFYAGRKRLVDSLFRRDSLSSRNEKIMSNMINRCNLPGWDPFLRRAISFSERLLDSPNLVDYPHFRFLFNLAKDCKRSTPYFGVLNPNYWKECSFPIVDNEKIRLSDDTLLALEDMGYSISEEEVS